jgi:proliferating cell nuclear antigen
MAELINNTHDNKILVVHTKKISVIKLLFEALKEIFRDVCIKFTPKITKPSDIDPTKNIVSGGMYITALNSNSNILVRIHLEADKFCYYKCEPNNDKNYITIGVNMANINKIIKASEGDSCLCMSQDQDKQSELIIEFINSVKKFTSKYSLNLLDLKEDNIVIAKQKFDFVITMPSNDFHNLIKNMSIISEKVDIKFICSNTGYSLIFSCIGEFASQESVFYGLNNEQSNSTINVLNTDEESKENIVQGVYALNALSLFSRCSSLCPTIELHIKNDSPLVIKYRVADMGSVHLILSPINEENEINNSESDADSDE